LPLISLWRKYKGVPHPVRHLGDKLVEIGAGTAFLSSPGQALWRRRLGIVAPPADVRAAIVAHVYYIELLDDVIASWQRCPVDTHLILTASEAVAVAIRNRLGTERHLTVFVCDNRGRDIAPFLSLLASGALDRFDAVLKLHSKQSPHLATGRQRQRLLFTILAGERSQIARILTLFRNPHVGMAGWRLAYRTHVRHWGLNQPRTHALVRRMSADTTPGAPDQKPAPASLNFFEGSMFYVRPAALVALRRLALTPADFEPEPSAIDGALHHAIERAFVDAVRIAGYDAVTLNGTVLEPRPPAGRRH
jgi:lipopolysaccharide biosynthesis protein